MAARSLNKVMLIGNLTRDPELRYTPSGTSVCSFGVATNREWVDGSGQKQESAEFHNIVAWGKLAEICDQLLSKGRKVFVEGRLSTRKWSGQDGVERRTTEVVIDEMVALDSARGRGEAVESPDATIPADLDMGGEEGINLEQTPEQEAPKEEKKTKKDAKKASDQPEKDLAEQVADDIPF